MRPQASLKNENPGALAGATGVIEKSIEDLADCIARWTVDASCITSAVYACAPENRLPLIEATYEHLCAGAPVFAADQDAMTWARCWAEIASRAERKAYALACFEAMPAHDQRAFLAYVTGRAAA